MEYVTQKTTSFNNTPQQIPEKAPPKIARAGILARVKFDQWHIIHAIRADVRNINALNLACLLAALARMDCTAYQITQQEIADKMGDYFGGPAPTRQAVGQWEKMLIKAGLLEKTRAAGRGKVPTKTRAFTQKFIDLSRRNMPVKLSYTGLHETKPNAAHCRGEKQVLTSLKHPVLSQTKIRAIEHIEKKPTPTPARFIGKKPKENQATRKPKPAPNRTPRPPRLVGRPGQKFAKLSKFQNSIRHWLFQNWNVGGFSEASILFALFLDLEKTDDAIAQIARAWPDLTDAARPGMVSQLVAHLKSARETDRQARQAGRQAAADALAGIIGGAGQELQTAPDIEPPARRNFRAALLGLAADYSGPCSHIVEHFHQADETEQETILKHFQNGAFDQWLI